MATTTTSARVMANRSIVSCILHHLSDMKYKDRNQRGPDQPVEFLEFRPTLVPSILVNKLWADEGTSLLWKRYPHLPALKSMNFSRRQYYASKVEGLFVLEPASEEYEDFAYLEGLDWPNLKSLELEIDWNIYGNSLKRMLHSELDSLEILGVQQSSSAYVADVLLPGLFHPCTNLRSVRIGPDTFDSQHPVRQEALSKLLESRPTIKDVRVFNAIVSGKDLLFSELSQRPGLETLAIDLDPGLQLLPLLAGTSGPLFRSLKKMQIMCYPEIALALPSHLPHIEELDVDIARIPDKPFLGIESTIIDDVIACLSDASRLRVLRINVGPLASNYPSSTLLPRLRGTSLVKLSASCPQLQDLTLLASEPAALDGSDISGSQFAAFCERATKLRYLSLKLHPGTAGALEDTALYSLGKYCQQLKVLRMKVALQPTSLISYDRISQDNSGNILDLIKGFETNKSVSNDHVDHHHLGSRSRDGISCAFPNLKHLAIARPQSVLYVASSSYATSLQSHSSTTVDPELESELVGAWAETLFTHFPQLEILESWSDWTGQDNDSLNYFLPLEEPLASTWEFLSGVEQDLWEDGNAEEPGEISYWDADFEEGISFDSRSSGDWEKASLMNEFPVENNTEYMDTPYEAEPDDMITPGHTFTTDEYFAHTDEDDANMLPSYNRDRTV